MYNLLYVQHDNLEASEELKSLSLTANEYVISASILVFLYIFEATPQGGVFV